jgi:hypothetical protein
MGHVKQLSLMRANSRRRVVPLPGHSESEQDEDDRERGYEQDDFDNQEDDERISKRQRIEVELTMPQLPLPVSKDGKVCCTVGLVISIETVTNLLSTLVPSGKTA